ncbi:MAG: hypothetical protein K8H74_00115 [Notoacmeibacter sp.]|nr:hypothetical protein [Notoacmeibacter sp.]
MKKLTAIITAAGFALAIPATGFALETGIGVGIGVGVDTETGVGASVADTTAGMTGKAATAADVEAITDPAMVTIEIIAATSADLDETTTASIESNSMLAAALQSNAAIAAKLSEQGFSVEDVKAASAKADGSVTLHVRSGAGE